MLPLRVAPAPQEVHVTADPEQVAHDASHKSQTSAGLGWLSKRPGKQVQAPLTSIELPEHAVQVVAASEHAVQLPSQAAQEATLGDGSL